MKKGALDTGKGTPKYINSPHKRALPFFCDPTKGEVDFSLVAKHTGVLGSFRIPAYQCAACQKIVLDYSGKAEKDPAFADLIKELK